MPGTLSVRELAWHERQSVSREMVGFGFVPGSLMR